MHRPPIPIPRWLRGRRRKGKGSLRPLTWVRDPVGLGEGGWEGGREGGEGGRSPVARSDSWRGETYGKKGVCGRGLGWVGERGGEGTGGGEGPGPGGDKMAFFLQTRVGPAHYSPT